MSGLEESCGAQAVADGLDQSDCDGGGVGEGGGVLVGEGGKAEREAGR